jgi:hypothetical protein
LDDDRSRRELRALNDQYATVIEIHLEYGNVLVSGAKALSSDDSQPFRRTAFFGTPLRLYELQDGIGLVSRTKAGDEQSFRAVRILHNFLDAVAMSQYGSFERFE